MSYVTDNIVYNNTHNIDVLNKNGTTSIRNILIKLTKIQNYLQLKLRDLNDFSFNFTANVDWTTFEKMKTEQYLEISYDEFHLQLIDLLKQTLTKDLLLRLECADALCKMVFYEKSKIKSLIFLIIDLILTNQVEIIDEMANNIMQLKETNKAITVQITNLKCQLQEKDVLLNAALTRNHNFEKQFSKDIKAVEDTFRKTLTSVERNVCINLDKLNKRHIKLMRDLEIVKKENKLKQNAFVQTLHQLEHVKRDSEKHLQTVDALKNELNNLNYFKLQSDKSIGELRQALLKKQTDLETLDKQIVELKKDIQEATVIIAQKSQTHDEIAKDLVQANTMLVNFNNQYDLMSKELDRLKEVVASKERIIRDQGMGLRKISEDFESYKCEYSTEDVEKLNHELFLAKQRIEELEKQNREAAKINGLLTKKLANGDVFDARNMNWLHPK